MAGRKIVLLVVLFHIVNSRPIFKELTIKKDFHFSFKPHEFKPITFVKEKWTHFGHIVAKHTMVKRSPLELAPIQVKSEAPPTFIVALEKSIEDGPFSVLPPLPPLELITPAPPMFTPEVSTPAPASVPPPPPPPVSVLPPIYVTEDLLSRLPVEGIEKIVVITPAPLLTPEPSVLVPEVTPPSIVMTPILPSPVPPSPVPSHEPPIPLPPSPLPPTPLVPVPPLQEVPIPKPLVQGNLLTDIGRVEEINAYIKAVGGFPPPPIGPPLLPTVSGNSIEEVPKPVVDEKLNSSPLVKGSRLALYFGNILLQVMSEVISSARSAISQYSQPAPI